MRVLRHSVGGCGLRVSPTSWQPWRGYEKPRFLGVVVVIASESTLREGSDTWSRS